MTLTNIVKTNLWDEQKGYPTPGIDTTKFTLVFTKLPNLQLLCNTVTLPSISLGVAQQTSPMMEFKHIGEKLVYSSFVIEFVLDQQLDSYKEVHEWMKKLSVQGLNSDTVTNSQLITSGGNYEFVNVFPIELSGINFDATQTDIVFPTCQVTFECDYYYPIIDK